MSKEDSFGKLEKLEEQAYELQDAIEAQEKRLGNSDQVYWLGVARDKMYLVIEYLSNAKNNEPLD